MVTQKVHRKAGITLTPELKFHEIAKTTGKVDIGFEYAELQPIIIASGLGEGDPSWTYEEAKGVAIQGSKWMLMVLKAPREMETISAFLDLAADVKERGSVLATLAIRDKKKATDYLRVQLYPPPQNRY